MEVHLLRVTSVVFGSSIVGAILVSRTVFHAVSVLPLVLAFQMRTTNTGQAALISQLPGLTRLALNATSSPTKRMARAPSD